MNKKYKELTVKLCKELQVLTYEFMMNNLEEEENTSEIINLILSSHMSSLFNCMIEIASDHKENTIKVKKFIDDIKKYISSLEPIMNIEEL